ncbi:MAG: pilus assembly protein PilM [Planctomycetales bacterium]|nr:pilus assembly protein PilM [Planctomycetales bacterium]
MPKSDAVWGIDIGQCALKALRCRPHESDPSKAVADAFDYIEYPKILSQPEADPEEMIREALTQFLSRNEVRGDWVAISVSGQSGLSRFIKLPPVDSKKIPDIVKFEAKQQIPFSLDDVVWDYQQMQGGNEADGFALDTEVGLFAMKRDQVFRTLQPLDDVEIEVDFIQLAPLSIYNAIVFDQMYDLPPATEIDSEKPPESVILVSIGTDNTDLVITNGYRVWQRSIPLGGNHFTKAVSKELKLTFAKAEHLKRNATEADDPKAVFQAMRPVFNDMLTEIQRSIGFFKNLDRSANITRIVGLGNALKLPGLQRFLSQNLDMEVATIEDYRGLAGGVVTTSPIFKENILSFAVSYGLCIQGLGKAALGTNLLPREFVTQRLIREKKPWAVAAASALLIGCTLNFLGHWGVWHSAHEDRYASVRSAAQAVSTRSKDMHARFDEAQQRFDELNTMGDNLVSNVEGRLLWLELYKAIKQALPHDPVLEGEEKPPIGQRRELHIESLDCEHFDELSTWYQGEVEKLYKRAGELSNGEEAEQPAAAEGEEDPDAAAPPVDATPPAEGEAAAEDTGPSGPGWVIQLTGYHYFNEDRNHEGATFVRETLIKNLKDGVVQLPGPTPGEMEEVSMKELGVGYPVIVRAPKIIKVDLQKPAPQGATGTRAPGVGEGGTGPGRAAEDIVSVKRFDFVVQFAWVETPPSARREAKQGESEEQPLDAGGGVVQAGF